MSEALDGTERADAQRAVLARIAAGEADNARLFAARMVLRAEGDSLWDAPLDGREQFGVLELAGTARIGLGKAARQLTDATKLVTELPGTLAGLEAGEVFEATAMLMLQLTRNCTPAVTGEVERRVLPVIARMNTTDARRLISQTIPQVEADLDPEATEQRLDQAAGDARVWQRELPDGMVELGACLDVLSGKRWALDFDELVRAQRITDQQLGIVRTAQQRRAAVFAQLPSRLIALIRAIQTGQIQQLLAIAQANPEHAQQLTNNLAALQALADHLLAPEEMVDAPAEIDAEEAAEEVNSGWPEECPWPTREPGFEVDHTSGVDPAGLLGAELCPDPRPEPEPGPETEPEPEAEAEAEADPVPEPPGAWTRDLMQQLVVHVLRLPVKDPRMLNVHVAMTTLAGLDNRTGSIDSSGAIIPAHQVRLMAPAMTWRRIVCDPDSGTPLGIDPVHLDPKPHHPAPHDPAPSDSGADNSVPDNSVPDNSRPDNCVPTDGAVGPVRGGISPHFSRLEQLLEPLLLIDQAESQHDPSAALRELIMLRDQRCIGIGCSLPAWRCHLDHEIPYPQGPTAAFDLSAKSARCHRAKHDGWTVTRPHDGPDSRTITWTSPLGHTYTRPSHWATLPQADQ